ncbi:MAG: sugar phosphorylase [Saprospiraceae bacterium]|nr:sugar phosphorylase [Saprospiraceae bacterium]
MKELIEHLYPQHKNQIFKEIEKLVEKYQPVFTKINHGPLSHEDTILITYGDAIQRKGEAPLKTLCEFGEAYFKEHINSIHLLPCFPYTSDDGFSVVDYYEINPELGSWQDIEYLKDHFYLMFDAVVNHMSQASEWFQGFLTAHPDYEDYFIKVDPSLDYSAVVRPRALPLFHKYNQGGEEINVWTTFSEDQVDLNFKSYKVFIQVLDILLFYARKGARYIRLDAIAFLWKKIGTSCLHLEETHKVIQAYRKVIEHIGADTVLVTETNVPHEENVSYFGDGYNEAHIVYNFSLPPLLAFSLMEEDVTVLTQWSMSLKLRGDQTCFFNFTASHDGIGVRPLQGIVPNEKVEQLAARAIDHGGFVSYKDNGDGTRSPYELNCNYMDLLSHPDESETTRIDKFLLTQSIMLCMPGVPGIYYHSLFGSRNDRDAAIKSGINRRINRQKLNVDILKSELDDKNSLRSRIFRSYSDMLKVRKETSAFDPFGEAEYSSVRSIYSIERRSSESQVLCIHNFSGQTQKLDFLDGNYRDLLTDDSINASSLIPGYGVKWLLI